MRKVGVLALAAMLPAAMVFLVAKHQVYLPLVIRSQVSSTPNQPPTPTSDATAITPPNQSPTPTPGATAITPYPDAPLCADSGESHDNSLFHTLWDGARGCHYDHEHGEYPFTPQVAAVFPGFDLQALIGGVGVGHTNPSSPMENTHKHGGFKWQVLLAHPNGCEGFEGSTIGVDASAIQYHAFGDYSIEFDARIHSALALMRQCRTDNPTDYGYIYVVQHIDYGQRVVPYQGTVMPYPDTPNPAYPSGLGPYFTMDCVGNNLPCRSRQSILDASSNANSIWTSDPRELIGSGSHLFELLFRVRDNYQLMDLNDQTYPFTFVWLCSTDGGASYSPVRGCRYNNSTTRIHEINGTIPAAWDNLTGFDTDPRIGRITASSYVTRFGDLNPTCTAAGPDCHPIKMAQAFIGYYGSHLIDDKRNQFRPEAQPERDIYFCGAQVCAEGDPGAVPSGWIGQNN